MRQRYSSFAGHTDVQKICRCDPSYTAFTLFGVLVAGIALFFLDPDGILYEIPRAAVNWVGGFDISAATSEFLQLR